MANENNSSLPTPVKEEETLRAVLLGSDLSLRERLQLRILDAYAYLSQALSRAAVLKRQIEEQERKLATGQQRFIRVDLFKRYQNALATAQEYALLLASFVSPYDTFLSKEDQKYFRILYTMLETNTTPDGKPLEVTFEMLSLFAKFLKMILYNLNILKIAEPKYSLALKAFTESLGE